MTFDHVSNQHGHAPPASSSSAHRCASLRHRWRMLLFIVSFFLGVWAFSAGASSSPFVALFPSDTIVTATAPTVAAATLLTTKVPAERSSFARKNVEQGMNSKVRRDTLSGTRRSSADPLLATCQNAKAAEHDSVQEFYEAQHPCTDKSTVHMYEYAYGKHFTRWKHQRLLPLVRASPLPRAVSSLSSAPSSGHTMETSTVMGHRVLLQQPGTVHSSTALEVTAQKEETTSRTGHLGASVGKRGRRRAPPAALTSTSINMSSFDAFIADFDALSPAQRENAAVSSATAPNAIKIFEIGLGCPMKCAAGGFQLLRKYWKGQLHYVGMEYDFDLCTRRWSLSGISPPDAKWLEHYVCRGDQGNLSTLHACLEKHGPFDVIIDDGSHMSTHMVTNFEYLFPKDKYLKPGGIYFLEDISSQFKPRWTDWVEKEKRTQWMYPNGHEMVQDMMSWKLCHGAEGPPRHTLTSAGTFAGSSPRMNVTPSEGETAAVTRTSGVKDAVGDSPAGSSSGTSAFSTTATSENSAARLESATAPPVIPGPEQAVRLERAHRRCPYMRFPLHGWRDRIWDRLGDVACYNEICVFQKVFQQQKTS